MSGTRTLFAVPDPPLPTCPRFGRGAIEDGPVPLISMRGMLSCAGPPADLSELLERGVEAVLRKDHSAALRAYRAAYELAPTDPTVAANVDRLEKLLHA